MDDDDLQSRGEETGEPLPAELAVPSLPCLLGLEPN